MWTIGTSSVSKPMFCLKTNSYLTLSFFTDKNTVILPNFSRYWYIGLHRLFQHQCSDTNQHTPNTKISNNTCQCFICPTLWDILVFCFWKVEYKTVMQRNWGLIRDPCTWCQCESFQHDNNLLWIFSCQKKISKVSTVNCSKWHHSH